jgi:O-antigen ligase
MFDELQEGTLTHRTLIWTAGLDIFRDHALIGTGAGSYGTAVLRAIDRPYVAHNSFLSVLVELGVIGVILFGGLLASMFYSALRMAPRERHFWLAMLITWVVGVSVLTWESRKPTWFLFAMLAAHVHASRTVVRRSVPCGARPTLAPWEQPLHPRAVDSL